MRFQVNSFCYTLKNPDHKEGCFDLLVVYMRHLITLVLKVQFLDQ